MEYQAAQPASLAEYETESKDVRALLTAIAVATGVPFLTMVIVSVLGDFPW